MAVQHQELVEAVAERVGISADEARQAAEATIATLAKTVAAPQRQDLLATVPSGLGQEVDIAPGGGRDADSFVAAVSWLTGTVPEQARYRAQAVLATLREHDPELIRALRLPSEIQDMSADLEPGGGITGPTGGTAPLTAEEVATALSDLPDWRGDTQALRRTLALPSSNLERVLARLELLQERTGRGPHVQRDSNSATIVVQTASVDAVTHLDVELAHRVNAVIDAAGAGIAS